LGGEGGRGGGCKGAMPPSPPPLAPQKVYLCVHCKNSKSNFVISNKIGTLK